MRKHFPKNGPRHDQPQAHIKGSAMRSEPKQVRQAKKSDPKVAVLRELASAVSIELFFLAALKPIDNANHGEEKRAHRENLQSCRVHVNLLSS